MTRTYASTILYKKCPAEYKITFSYIVVNGHTCMIFCDETSYTDVLASKILLRNNLFIIIYNKFQIKNG